MFFRQLQETFSGHFRFQQIGIPAMSTTGYSLKGCWGFIPPFGLGLPNCPSQIPFQRRHGGHRFSRRRFPSSPAETSSSQQRSHLPPEEYPFHPHKKGQPSRITLFISPALADNLSSASSSSTGCITSLITIIVTITSLTIIATITSLITSNRACRPLHNLNSLFCQHLKAYILKLELLDLAAAG